MPTDIVLSHYQVNPLKRSLNEGFRKVDLSLNLGMTRAQVELLPEGVLLNQLEMILWDSIDRINKSKNSCFQVINGQTIKLLNSPI